MEFFIGFFAGIILFYIVINFTLLKEKNSLKEENIWLKAQNSQSEQNAAFLENLASKIFKENTKDFAELNQKELESLLRPFKENLHEFGQKMEQVKTQNTELKTQIEVLKTSSENLSKEAQNLTEALKGNSKIQGNWGEILLKRILEASGLEEDVHYSLQDSFSVDGNRFQTDCIVNLGENRNVIIDSKVSLIPLQNFYQAPDEISQKECLKELERSVRNHIDTLDKKAYQDIETVGSSDYVLMFMPVESAFNLMMSKFDAIMDYAWRKRVLIVSPSSLMVALKTVEMFWQQEKRNKTTDEIVKIAGEFYDKFVGIITHLENIAGFTEKIQDNLKGVDSKMRGHGGMASQVKRLQDFGAKTKKQIPQEYIEVE